MGYGSRAIDLLISYFQGSVSSSVLPVGEFGGEGGDGSRESAEAHETADLTTEVIAPKAKLPPLLVSLEDRPCERLHWLGVSFGLTDQLLNFWSRKGFKVVYLRQTPNDLTGEHSTIMLREMDCSDVEEAPEAGWLLAYVRDYRRRLISLMSYAFRALPTALALTLLDPDRELTSSADRVKEQQQQPAAVASMKLREDLTSSPLTVRELLTAHMSQHDLQRLELYSRNMVDHHMILDLLPTLAKLLFSGRLKSLAAVSEPAATANAGPSAAAEDSSLGGLHLSALQAVVVLGMGLQHRDVDDLCAELNLPSNQVLAFFNKTVRKITSILRALVEKDTELELRTNKAAILRMGKRAESMVAVGQSLASDQSQDSKLFAEQQRKLLMSSKDLSKHAITAADDDLKEELEAALKKSKHLPSSISVPVNITVESHKRKELETGGSREDKHAKKQKKHKHTHLDR
jgi:N-acetyltransferase 10